MADRSSFFTGPGPAPQSRTTEICFFTCAVGNRICSTLQTQSMSLPQSRKPHVTWSAGSPLRRPSSLTLLCLCFSSSRGVGVPSSFLWFRLLYRGGESSCPRSAAPATFPLLPSRRQVAQTIPFPRRPTTERRHEMVAWEPLSDMTSFHTTAQTRRQSSARALRGWFARKACLVSLRGDRWVVGRSKGVFAISVSSALPRREVSLSLSAGLFVLYPSAAFWWWSTGTLISLPLALPAVVLREEVAPQSCRSIGWTGCAKIWRTTFRSASVSGRRTGAVKPRAKKVVIDGPHHSEMCVHFSWPWAMRCCVPSGLIRQPLGRMATQISTNHFRSWCRSRT